MRDEPLPPSVSPADVAEPLVVNMGAYELQPKLCRWDFNDGDGTVGILDLLYLLANWGPCA